jgi:chorismate mutase / prephenate dehydratase
MATDKTDSSSLDSMRRQIDEVDDRLHDLLMRRAELVESVAGVKRSGRVAPFRPGREAQILRRLVGRHRGRFPRPALVRIWRELLGGTVAMQAPLSVVVCEDCWELARDHFGSQAPMLGAPSADEAIVAVGEGRATVGVLPLPDEDASDPWWLRLAADGEGKPRIIARLPFGTVGNAVDACQDAFVVAAMDADPSGDDCTLLAVGAPRPISTASLTDAFLAARIDCTPLAAVERDGTAAYLVELDALLAVGDPQIARALARLDAQARANWLGCYARPLPDASLGGIAPE